MEQTGTGPQVENEEPTNLVKHACGENYVKNLVFQLNPTKNTLAMNVLIQK